jgi:HK97 family phage prohead protease
MKAPMMSDTKEALTRQVDFTLTRSEDGGDGMTLEGYAAVTNTPTRIDSYEGRFDEVIATGAFKKTLAERGTRVVLQFDHGSHPLIGSLPIGQIQELSEDARGLYVKARLFDNDLVKPVRQAIDGGAIQGMSFRFSVVGESWDESGDTDLRTITELKLFEIGPVVFPAYEETSVGVRARQIAADLTDTDVREQVINLLATAPSTSAAGDSTDGQAAPLDDAATRHVDRSEEHARALASINKHIIRIAK